MSIWGEWTTEQLLNGDDLSGWRPPLEEWKPPEGTQAREQLDRDAAYAKYLEEKYPSAHRPRLREQVGIVPGLAQWGGGYINMRRPPLPDECAYRSSWGDQTGRGETIFEQEYAVAEPERLDDDAMVLLHSYRHLRYWGDR